MFDTDLKHRKCWMCIKPAELLFQSEKKLFNIMFTCYEHSLESFNINDKFVTWEFCNLTDSRKLLFKEIKYA